MAHEIFYTCCILYMRAWVFDHWVFGPSFPSFLSPYHPSLRYVPCLKTTLRPWDQISFSAASAWTGVWDSVAIWISSCFFFWETPFWRLDSFQLCWDYRDHAFDGGWFDDTWPFLIYHTSDAIHGHISVRMRFTDHEGVACLSLFARCM